MTFEARHRSHFPFNAFICWVKPVFTRIKILSHTPQISAINNFHLFTTMNDVISSDIFALKALWRNFFHLLCSGALLMYLAIPESIFCFLCSFDIDVKMRRSDDPSHKVFFFSMVFSLQSSLECRLCSSSLSPLEQAKIYKFFFFGFDPKLRDLSQSQCCHCCSDIRRQKDSFFSPQKILFKPQKAANLMFVHSETHSHSFGQSTSFKCFMSPLHAFQNAKTFPSFSWFSFWLVLSLAVCVCLRRKKHESASRH